MDIYSGGGSVVGGEGEGGGDGEGKEEMCGEGR